MSAYRYRVNFGNGQVHYPGATKRECFAFIAAHCDGFAFVEWCDPDTGEWFATGTNHQQ